ncbi:MAG: aspartate carbamoyltransferase, partial [Candidatus Paceibacterota bacterium]
ADRAAAVSDSCGFNIPIVNAGDGTGQHPTQALLDLCTIHEQFDHIDGLTVVIGGDLAHGRTARSLAYLLSKFNIKLIFVSTPELTIGEDIQAHLKEKQIEFRLDTDLEESFPEADVVYWTRFQKERVGDATANLPHRITLETMALLRSKAILLHPLPIVGEIAREVDEHPQARYFHQAQNGMFVRMALLQNILA